MNANDTLTIYATNWWSDMYYTLMPYDWSVEDVPTLLNKVVDEAYRAGYAQAVLDETEFGGAVRGVQARGLRHIDVRLWTAS